MAQTVPLCALVRLKLLKKKKKLKKSKTMLRAKKPEVLFFFFFCSFNLENGIEVR